MDSQDMVRHFDVMSAQVLQAADCEIAVHQLVFSKPSQPKK